MPPKKAAALLEQPLNSAKQPGAEVKTSKRVKINSVGHPSTLTMVVEALKKHDDKRGTSVQAIRSHILATYPSVDPGRLTFLLRKAFAKGIETGILVRPAKSSALGATGRFKLVTKKLNPKEASKMSENVDPNTNETPTTVRKVPKKPKSTADVGLTKTGDKVEKTKPVSRTKVSSQVKTNAVTAKAVTAKEPGKATKMSTKVSRKVPREIGTKTDKNKNTEANKVGSSAKSIPAKKNKQKVSTSFNGTKKVKRK